MFSVAREATTVREKVEGVNTVKVTGTIDTAVIDPIVPRLGEKAGVLPITLWIYDVAPPATSRCGRSRSTNTAPSTASGRP